MKTSPIIDSKLFSRAVLVATVFALATGCSQPSQTDANVTPPQAVAEATQKFATASVSGGDITYTRIADGRYASTFRRDGKSFRLMLSPSGAIKEISETLSYAPHSDSARNLALSAAVSPCEDFIEMSLAKDQAGSQTALVKLEAAIDALNGTIDAKTLADLGQALTSAKTSNGVQDSAGAMSEVLTLYRRLLDLMDAARLLVPVQVGLLDHAGFKVSALMSSATPNWTEAVATTTEGARIFREMEKQISNRNLSALTEHIIRGAQHATSQRDAVAAQIAASQLLAVVDLLERDFEERFKVTSALPGK